MTNQQKKLDTFWVIEATDFEQLMLWEKYAQKDLGFAQFNWSSDPEGYLATIAEISIEHKAELMPVSVTITWSIINGKRIAFWEATSQIVDFRLIKPWLEKEFPNAKGFNNAWHFGYCINAIKKLQ